MAAKSGQQNSSVIDRLFEEVYRFDFFQAVQILERLSKERALTGPDDERSPVGYDSVVDREIVRFRATPALSFPAGPISKLRKKSVDSSSDQESTAPLEMLVTFLGLTGPSGVLPDHYTTLLMQRIRDKDHSLQDFLDLFNHRTISLFYRAWEKYHLPTAFEKSHQKSVPGDMITQCLYCLIGMGEPAQRGRSVVDDEVLLYYSGYYAHSPRTAVGLESLLADYCRVPVVVKQFQGQWLQLARDDRSRLPGADCPQGQFNQLGKNVVAGERVWDVQGKFRIKLGPLTYQQFLDFMPNGKILAELSSLTRSYVGPELDFDVQPILRSSEIPVCRLVSKGDEAPHLGWNVWLRSEEIPRQSDTQREHVRIRHEITSRFQIPGILKIPGISHSKREFISDPFLSSDEDYADGIFSGAVFSIDSC